MPQAGIAAVQIRSRPDGKDRTWGKTSLPWLILPTRPMRFENALQTVRQITHGRVIAVFGAAGLRDRQKRRMMAETSIELADLTILTAEDPRTELLEDILDEMAAGADLKGGYRRSNFLEGIPIGVKRSALPSRWLDLGMW